MYQSIKRSGNESNKAQYWKAQLRDYEVTNSKIVE